MLPKFCSRVKFVHYLITEIDLKNFLKKYWFLFIVAAVLIGIDQVTKAMIRVNIPLGTWIIPIKGFSFLKFAHITNDGVAFGMLQGAGWIFALLALIVAGVIFYYFPKIQPKDGFIRWALALQLGGALGNLIDRLYQNGKVTDFIAAGNFAVFNVADSCISVGTVLLLIGVWIQEAREKREKKQEAIDAEKKLSE